MAKKRQQPKEIIITDGSVLNEILRSMIDESGKTRYEIAAATNITQAALSRQYHGKSVPSLESLVKVAEAIGYRVIVRIEKTE